MNGCPITCFKSPWRMYSSLSNFSSSPGGRSFGRNKWVSSVWKKMSNAGDACTVEQLWEEYFADNSEWWDNRVDKSNPNTADFRHKVTRKTLWVDGWSTPPWAKAMLKLMPLGEPCTGYYPRGSQDTSRPNRLSKSNNGDGNPRLTSTKELRQFVQVDDATMHLQTSSTMSEAIAVLKNHDQQCIRKESFMYVEVLQRCFKQKDLVSARQVHGCIIKSRMEQNIYVANNLLRVYIGCERLKDARQVFDKLLKKDVFSWTIMIGGYAQQDHAEDAYEVFNQMRQQGVQPDEITYLSILKACASPVALEWGKEVHAHIRHGKLQSDVRVGTALLKMYAKCGSIKEARQIFDNLTNRDVISWTVMIGAYAESGCGHEAYELFLQMQREGLKPTVITWTTMIGGLAQHGFGHEAFSLFLQMQRRGFLPDATTYVSILNPCASAGALEWVKVVHGHALKAGLESDLRVGNALVHMYAKSGSIIDARLVFNRMVDRDLITWTMMIGGLAQHGCGHEGFSLFLQMLREGFVPNATTYVSILNACASAGALEWVKEVHNHALNAGLESDLRVGNAFIHMYAKSGSIEDALLVFDRMVDRDVITWNVTIGGLAQHGCGHEALQLYEQMKVEGVKPNGVSFVAVLSACSHAGLLNEGRKHFMAMTQDYCINPTVVHYNCMVDLLGRAGHLEEAKLFIDKMPLEPDGATWGALLGACRTYGNMALAEVAAKERLKLEPNDASAYVLLSNIYAAAGEWDQVSLVRKMMQGSGIHKEPGRSWIEVDKKIHQFVVQDTSHPEAKEIYAELNKLTEKLKAEGYIPDTKLVLHNIDEEDKELALCSHSEKLAIVYGLMHMSHGKPIRIYKNLRLCSDCHTATKFISKVTGRVIVARDANRFHHFKDGLCSCGDYW